MARKRLLSVLTINTKKNRAETQEGLYAEKNGGAVKLGEPLSPAGQLFHEPRFNCHIICVLGNGIPIDVQVFIKGLEETLVKHPRFSSIQVHDESTRSKELRWAPCKVNVPYHIIIPALFTNPASPSSNERLIEDYISSLSVTTMSLGRPLWEFHIINLPTAKSASTVIFRCHHSLGDGMSLMSLLLACTRRLDDPTSLPSIPEPPRRSGPIYAQSRPGHDAGVWALVMWIFSNFALVWNTVVDTILFAASSLFLKDTETPLKGREGVEFQKKRFVHQTLQFNDIKRIKNVIGCTINDVMLGITSAALSRYLHRKQEEKDGKKFPKKLRVRSTLLVNIRPSPGIHSLAEMMDGEKTGARFGNQLGYALLEIPSEIYDDPLDYVRKVKAIATRKKNSLQYVLIYKSAGLFLKLFGTKITSHLSNKVLMNTTFLFLNIIGPQEELCFYGHPIVYMAPSVYGHPQALTIHCQSYNNKMELVLAVDESAIPDSHQLLDDFVKSLIIITNAASKLSENNKNIKPN